MREENPPFEICLDAAMVSRMRSIYAYCMARWEQYEVWVYNRDKWDLLAHFNDMEIASAIFKNRTYRQKLVHAVYENGSRVSEDVMAELGRTREEP